MNKKQIKFIIANSSPFNRLSEPELDKLLAISQAAQYQDGELVYHQGGLPDYFYFLLKGRVVASALKGHKDHKIEIIKRGTCFGIISLLTGDAHSVTAKSIESSLILRIAKSKFKVFLKANPQLALELSLILSQRVKARSKPKTVFQSKRIAVLGSVYAGKSTYMVDLASELDSQTGKRVVCVQILNPQEDLHQKHSLSLVKGADNILCLKKFREDDLKKFIVKKNIDYLFVKMDAKNKFSSLMNFLSESYHFILYEAGGDLFDEHNKEFTACAHQIHYITFPQKKDLAKCGSFIVKSGLGDPLSAEKIKVILAEFAVKDILAFDKKYKILKHSIYATLPAKSSDDYPRVLMRIARQIGGVVLGLALGSGAAYGFSHIGVLKVLEREGVDIDIVCGSSMGAIIAALWAADFSIEEMAEFGRRIGKGLKTFSLGGISIPFRGIIRSRRLETIFKSIFKDLTFYDLKHTLKIVAFDFLKRTTIVIDEGPLYKALAGSCAFPGIFEPVKFKKDLLLDGGILNPLPTSELLNFGADKIIASNITLSQEQAVAEYRRRDRFHIFDFIFGSIETMQRQFVENAVKISDVVIHPDLEGLGWMEFEKITEFIERGEAAAREKISQIRELVSS